MAIDINNPDQKSDDFGNSSNWDLANGAAVADSRWTTAQTAAGTDGINDDISSKSSFFGLHQSSGANQTFSFNITTTDNAAALIAAQINRTSESAGNAWEFEIRDGTNSRITFYSDGTTDNSYIEFANNKYNNGNPHMIMFSASSGDIKLWVDGVSISVTPVDVGAGYTGVNATCTEDATFGHGLNDAILFADAVFDRPRYWNDIATDANALDFFNDEIAAELPLSNYDLVNFAKHNYSMNDGPGVKPEDSLSFSYNFLSTTGSPDNTGAGIIMTRNPPEDQGYHIPSGPNPFRYNLGNMSYAVVFENLLTEAEQGSSTKYFYGTLSSPGGAFDFAWLPQLLTFRWALSGFADAGARFDVNLGRLLKVGEKISIACSREDIGNGYHAAYETSEGDKGSATRTGAAGRPSENRGVFLNSANNLTVQAHQKARRMITSFGNGQMRIADVEADAALGLKLLEEDGQRPNYYYLLI